MDEKPTASIDKYFGKIRDPRIGNAKRHKLIDILAIAICAMLCGTDGWSDMKLFGKNQQTWLKKFLGLPT